MRCLTQKGWEKIMQFDTDIIVDFELPSDPPATKEQVAVALQYTIENILKEHLKDAEVVFVRTTVAKD